MPSRNCNPLTRVPVSIPYYRSQVTSEVTPFVDSVKLKISNAERPRPSQLVRRRPEINAIRRRMLFQWSKTGNSREHRNPTSGRIPESLLQVVAPGDEN